MKIHAIPIQFLVLLNLKCKKKKIKTEDLLKSDEEQIVDLSFISAEDNEEQLVDLSLKKHEIAMK